jgi:hypothetical protein
MSAIEKRLANLEECLKPALPRKVMFANSKAHADQLAAEEAAERAKNPAVRRRPLTIIRWLESKEEAAASNVPDLVDDPANHPLWQQVSINRCPVSIGVKHSL